MGPLVVFSYQLGFFLAECGLQFPCQVTGIALAHVLKRVQSSTSFFWDGMISSSITSGGHPASLELYCAGTSYSPVPLILGIRSSTFSGGGMSTLLFLLLTDFDFSPKFWWRFMSVVITNWWRLLVTLNNICQIWNLDIIRNWRKTNVLSPGGFPSLLFVLDDFELLLECPGPLILVIF